jgi:hypothetical protein
MVDQRAEGRTRQGLTRHPSRREGPLSALRADPLTAQNLKEETGARSHERRDGWECCAIAGFII